MRNVQPSSARCRINSQSVQFEMARVMKAHNDLLRTYEAKLAEYGIPKEELGFTPLRTDTSTGPAGLVAAPS